MGTVWLLRTRPTSLLLTSNQENPRGNRCSVRFLATGIIFQVKTIPQRFFIGASYLSSLGTPELQLGPSSPKACCANFSSDPNVTWNQTSRPLQGRTRSDLSPTGESSCHVNCLWRVTSRETQNATHDHSDPHSDHP